MKTCDHTSVGMLVWKDDRLLLIKKQNYPFAYAPPAGHVDEDSSYKDAAIRELREEVGLATIDLKLVASGRKDNKCSRIDGTYHDWKIYNINAAGDITIDINEVKNPKWYTTEELKSLSKVTEEYIIGTIKEEVWKEHPGIEVVWYDWFKEIGIL